MFYFFRIIKNIKRIKKIEPDKKWLADQRRNFLRLSGAEKIPDTNFALAKKNWFDAFHYNFFRPIFAGFILMAGFFAGLVNFSQTALPDESFYPLKLFSEKINGYFIFNNEKKIDFILRITQRRLEEIERRDMTLDSDPEAILAAISQVEDNLEKAAALLES